MLTGMHHHDVESAGTRIHYVRSGHPAGAPIMLVHGFPQSWRCWQGVGARLVDRHALVMPDLRGFGDSARPATGYGATVACDDLIAVLDACGLERVTLVGHDWGAVVAHVCAALHPDRVERLVFVEAPVLGTDPASWPSFWHMAFLAKLDLPEALIAGNETAFVRAFMLDYAGRPYALREEEMAAYARHLADPGGLRAALAWYREAPANDFAWLRANALPKLTMPVLALGGTGSWGDLPRTLMEQVATDVTGGVFDGVGHWVPEEDPERLSAAIRSFAGS